MRSRVNPGKALLQRSLGMNSLGDDAPRFSLTLGRGAAARADYVLRSPFRRSAVLILVAAAFLVAFSVPLFTLGGFFEGGDGSLFSLITTLFSLFWMLGWSTGVGMLLLFFLCLVCGRETLSVADDRLNISIGIPGVALMASYGAAPIRNFRYCEHEILESRKWRGKHLVFDYGGVEVGFGSELEAGQAREIIARLTQYFPEQGAAPMQVDATPTQPDTPVEEVATASAPKPSAANASGIPLRWYSASGLALLAANLIPLAGVLLAGWDIGEIMLLFWAESAIIGYFNLCKMRRVGGWTLLFYGPFFVAHYGAFMVVHLLFIYALFVGGVAGEADVAASQVMHDLLRLWPALLGLLISHSISYYSNFVVVEKHRGRTMSFQMQEPYRRIIIMHLTVIFGGFLSLAFGSGVGALLLLLGLKIAADMRAHLAQHAN